MLIFKKKHSISPSDLKVTHNSAHVTDPDPSLGVLGRNFMEILNIGSVRSGSVGIPIRALRPKLPVWVRNSSLRVARTILIADLESTQNLGSVRVFSGVFGYFWAQMQTPTRFSDRTAKPDRSLYLGPQIPEHTQKYPTRPMFCADTKSAIKMCAGYPQSRVTDSNV